MNNRKRSNQHNQKGVALVIALVVLFLLTALAAALIFATQSEMWATNNYQQLSQARYAAEAGAQMAKNWFENTSDYASPASLTSFNTATYPVQCATGATGCTSGTAIVLGGSAHNFPTSAVETSFYNAFTNQSVPGMANASYSVTAKLMQIPSTTGTQMWQITSTGTVAGAKTATTQVVENITYTPGNGESFPDAVVATSTGCANFGGSPPTGITFSSGSSYTDGYNSGSGAYCNSTMQKKGTCTTLNVNDNAGSIASGGNVSMSGGGVINGTVYGPSGTTGNCSSGTVTSFSTSGGSTASGGVSQKALPVFPSANVPTGPAAGTETISGVSCPAGMGSLCSTSGCSAPNPKNTSQTITGVTLSPGTYDDINISGGSLVCFTKGTYNINSLNSSGGSYLALNSTPITMNVLGSGNPTNGPFNLSGGSILNSTEVASNFVINYNGTGEIQLSGGSGSAAAVYAPNAPVNLSGGSDWYGAIVCSAFNDSGGSSVHYDTALSTAFSGAGTPTVNVAGFTWNKN